MGFVPVARGCRWRRAEYHGGGGTPSTTMSGGHDLQQKYAVGGPKKGGRNGGKQYLRTNTPACLPTFASLSFRTLNLAKREPGALGWENRGLMGGNKLEVTTSIIISQSVEKYFRKNPTKSHSTQTPYTQNQEGYSFGTRVIPVRPGSASVIFEKGALKSGRQRKAPVMSAVSCGRSETWTTQNAIIGVHCVHGVRLDRQNIRGPQGIQTYNMGGEEKSCGKKHTQAVISSIANNQSSK